MLFIALAVLNNFALVSVEKYPPTAYYLSYGMMASVILYLLLETDAKIILILKKNKLIRWISQNSLWIYLWYIISIKILVDYNIFYIDS